MIKVKIKWTKAENVILIKHIICANYTELCTKAKGIHRKWRKQDHQNWEIFAKILHFIASLHSLLAHAVQIKKIKFSFMDILQLSISIRVLFLLTLLLFWNSHFTLEQNCVFFFSLTKEEHVASHTELYLHATTTLSTLSFAYSNCDFKLK